MKKISCLIIILIILTTQLFAQPTPPPPDYSISVRQVGASGGGKIEIEYNTYSTIYDYPIFIGYYEQATVTLTAINHEYPDGAVNVFTRWEGDVTSYENPITIDVYKPLLITAVYVHGDPLPTHEPTPMPTPRLGDVNDDDEINIIDALLIAQFYVGFSPPGTFLENADVNCDAVIDIIDALLIAQYYVELITEFCS